MLLVNLVYRVLVSECHQKLVLISCLSKRRERIGSGNELSGVVEEEEGRIWEIQKNRGVIRIYTKPRPRSGFRVRFNISGTQRPSRTTLH